MAEETTGAPLTTGTPVTPAAAIGAAPTPEPKTYREHYAAAAAKVSQSSDQETPPAEGSTASATPPTEETQPTGDPSPETVSTDDTLLPAEEVAKLSPKERTLYEKAQKNYTLKTQQLAAQRKELEPVRELYDALNDPARAKDAASQLARHYGLLPKDDDKPVVTSATKPVQLPEELEGLRPIFQSVKDQAKAEAVAELKAEIDPFKAQTTELTHKALTESTTATLTTFGQTHPGWEKHEAKMLDIAKQFQPTGNMSELDYLDALHKLATYGQQSAQQTKQVVEKLTKAANAAEEVTPSTQAERVEYARPANIAQMSSRERYIAATEAAKRNQKWV